MYFVTYNLNHMIRPVDGDQRMSVSEAIVLDKIDPNLFLARPENLWKPPYARAVFGGQVLGQALAAASQTVAPSLV